MKGIIPLIAVVIVGLAAVGLFFIKPGAITNTVSDCNEFNLAGCGTVCPAGTTKTLITDPVKCGTATVERDRSKAGICTVITCSLTSTADKLAFCLTSTANDPTTVRRLAPGETTSYPDQCNAFKNSGTMDSINYIRWVEQTKQCFICQQGAKLADECSIAENRCDPGNKATAQTCYPPDAQKPYNHWGFSFACNAGNCISTGTSAISCVQVCSGDSSCLTGQFCESGACKLKRPDGASCSVNNQCASNLCSNGVCKTGTTTGVGTSCDPGVIKTSEDCIQCGGTWKDPGLFGRGLTSLFGGKTEPASCDLPLVNRDIGRTASLLTSAFFGALIIIIIIFVAGHFIPAVGLFSRNPMIMLVLLAVLTLLFFLAGAGK